MPDPRIQIEERLAHLERTVEELSDIVARQANDIAALKARVQLLMEREAARETEGGVVLGDEKPPHW